MIDNLTQYRYFFEAAKEGSISAAAKKLYVTQPAVSAMIASLESSLGVKLFLRTGRGIRLTYEGEMLFASVRTAFSFLETGEENIREMSGLSGGMLRIGASDMTLRFYLLDIIESFRRDFPRVRLSVTNAPTPKTLSTLKSGAIDLCAVTEPLTDDPEIEAFPVREVRDVFVASDAFPLRDRTVARRELSSYPLVMLERTASTRRFDDAHFTGYGLDAPEPEIELATSDLVVDFAGRGIGIGCVAYDFAREAIERGELYEISLDHPIPPRRFMLAYLKDLPQSASAKEFIRRAREKALSLDSKEE